MRKMMYVFLICLVLLSFGCASQQDVRLIKLENDIREMKESIGALENLGLLNTKWNSIQQEQIDTLQKRLAQKTI